MHHRDWNVYLHFRSGEVVGLEKTLTDADKLVQIHIHFIQPQVIGGNKAGVVKVALRLGKTGAGTLTLGIQYIPPGRKQRQGVFQECDCLVLGQGGTVLFVELGE